MNVDTSKPVDSQDLKHPNHLNRSQLLATKCGRLECLPDSGDLQPRTIQDFVNAVQSAPSGLKKEAIDEFAAHDKSQKYDELKLKIAAWMPCGYGGKSRNTATPNGFVTLDIDHISRGCAVQIKETLCKLPFIGLCCLSLSQNGVFALIYAPEYVCDADAIKSEIYGTIDIYLKAKHPGIGFGIDQNCTDFTRKRVETFDPDIFLSDDIKPYERNDELIMNAWNSSETKRLAAMFGFDNITPGHAAVVGLLALAAASSRLSLWDRDIFNKSKTYQARIGAIILGKSGAGKGNLIDSIREIAHELGIYIQNYKTTAAMAQGVSLACNTREPDEQNPKQDKWTPKQIKDIRPIIEINDEDYAARELAKLAAYAMDKLAERRKILDRRYQPQTTKKESLPDYEFTASYQYICVSQLESFAAAIQGERTDTGDGRRELLGNLLDDETNDDMHFSDRQFIADMNSRAADTAAITAALQTAYKNHKDRCEPTFESMSLGAVTTDKLASIARGDDFHALTWHNHTNCQYTFMRCLKAISTNESESMDAKTHLANIAAIECYLSGRDEMTPRDILTAAAITRESFALRRRLQARCDEIAMNAYNDNAIKWLELYWKDPAKIVSIQAYNKAKHGKVNKHNESMVAQWEMDNLVVFYVNRESGPAQRVRRGTEKELSERAKELEIGAEISKKSAAKLNELTTRWDSQHGRAEQYATRQRPTFADDTPEAQRIRVCEMINRCIDGKKCGQLLTGERQKTLYRISNVLIDNGMWGTIAREILTELGRESGLPEKEIKHALRDRR